MNIVSYLTIPFKDKISIEKSVTNSVRHRSHRKWSDVKMQPLCHRSHPRTNQSKWYSIMVFCTGQRKMYSNNSLEPHFRISIHELNYSPSEHSPNFISYLESIGHKKVTTHDISRIWMMPLSDCGAGIDTLLPYFTK